MNSEKSNEGDFANSGEEERPTRESSDDFSELLKYEEESNVYVEQLEKEEAELRRQLEEQLKKNNALEEQIRMLKAMIEAQEKYRESLGVAKLEEKNDEKEREVERMRAEAVSLRTKIVENSSNMLKVHAQDVNEMHNRLKRFWDPNTVSKEYDETKEKISKVMDALKKKKHVEGEVLRYQEQQNVNEMIKMISVEVKAAAEAEKKAVDVLKEECGVLEEELGVQKDQLNRQ